MLPRVLFLTMLLAHIVTCNSNKMKTHYQYIVIGAGAGGLQAAYFLDLYNMDYAVLERNHHAGSFYDYYPRHRKLISINKAYVPSTNKDFAMRHDWNSLVQEPIDDPDAFYFTAITKDYFPTADQMVQYQNQFAEKYQLNIFYNITLQKVHKETPKSKFVLKIQGSANGATEITCDVLLMATGRMPTRPKPRSGYEHLTYYDDMSTNNDDYEGKDVLIIGSGNSALETMDALQDAAAHIHLAYRPPLRFAYQTHYVGDIRAINIDFVDKVQLYGADQIVPFQRYPNGTTGSFHELSFTKRDGKIYVSSPENPEIERASRYGYDKVIVCSGFTPDLSIFDDTTRPRMIASRRFPMTTAFYESSNVSRMYFIGNLMHGKDFGKASGGFIHGFRYTTRTVIGFLRQRYQGVSYPTTSIKFQFFKQMDTIDTQPLIDAILQRINTASSLYQMFGVLGDVYVLSFPKSVKITQAAIIQATQFLDMPMSAMDSSVNYNITKPGDCYFTVTLEYGEDFQGLGVMLHKRQKKTLQQKRRYQMVKMGEDDPEDEYNKLFIPTSERMYPYVPPQKVDGVEGEDESLNDTIADPESGVATEILTADGGQYQDANNFLHPVVRFYKRLPNVQKGQLIGAPHHITEDFLTDWNLPEYMRGLGKYLQMRIVELYKEALLDSSDEL